LYIYIPCVVMAFLVHIDFNILDLFYSYSIWLEAFAILPQLYMLHQNAHTQGNVIFFKMIVLNLEKRLKISQYIIFWRWAFTGYFMWFIGCLISFFGQLFWEGWFRFCSMEISSIIIFWGFNITTYSFINFFFSLKNKTSFTLSV